MADKYKVAVEKVHEENAKIDNSDYLDFHTHRLVKSARYIILGYLLLINDQKTKGSISLLKISLNMAKLRLKGMQNI